jgi:hypothetical protein
MFQSLHIGRAVTLALTLALIGLLGAATLADADYVPGRGLRLADNKLTIGGYSSFELSFLDESKNRAVLEDLSLFITYQPFSKLKIFAEIETEETFEISDQGFGTGNKEHELERLYLAYQVGSATTITLGKTLTPFGIWNVIHAEPLVWTSSRPITTEEFFRPSVTGIRVDQNVELRDLVLDATAYAQPSDEFEEGDVPQQASETAGGRLALSQGDRWTTGLSFLRFRDREQRRWESTAGIDAIFRTAGWEVSTEAAANKGDQGPTLWGAYVQVVRHMGRNLHPFLRVEHVKLVDSSGTPVTIGLAYKPATNIVLKAEVITAAGGLGTGGNGLLSSVAILF